MKSLIFDCSAVCHASRHAYGGLSYQDMHTGVIYGFLIQVLNLSEKFDTTDLVFAWDSRTSVRRDEFPDYKKKRKEKIISPEEQEMLNAAFGQFIKLQEVVLPRIGFVNNFLFPGYEADDIIGSVVKGCASGWIVVSSDNDLYQLLEDCKMWKPQAKKLYTRHDLMNDWGVSPTLWAEVKTIAGCRGDEVPGVPGVAEKTAIKFLLGNLKGKKLSDIGSLKSLEIRKRNKRLVTLPHPDFEGVRLYNQPPLDFGAALDVCNDLGMYSLTEGTYLARWRRLCDG